MGISKKLSKLKIASRQSDLARLQTETVAKAIHKKFPEIEIEFHFRASLGDQNQSDPLWKMPEKGVFTEDFYQDLVSEKVDLVVHSWKDLPIEKKADTEIVASLLRSDQRDLFLFKSEHMSSVVSSKTLKILTSSPRRAYNLLGFFKDYFPCEIAESQFLNVRGNILTRLKKLISEDVDALIVAKAALDRLLTTDDPQYLASQNEIKEILRKCRWMCLPLTINPSAAAQGALAIEAKKNSPWKSVLAEIHNPECFQNVEREREILAQYGGGCHQKIGVSVLKREFGEVCFLRGLTDKGEILDSVRLKKNPSFDKARSLECVFPTSLKQQVFFERVKHSSPQISQALKEPHLWVTREQALPENFSASDQQIIWTSGLKTWSKLAKRGVWINGSAESLGENEDCRLEVLAQIYQPELGLNFRWTKLTHDEGFQNPDMNVVSTYHLKPLELDLKVQLDLRQITHFFWSSGSGFDFLSQRYPEIKKAWHFCGPGHSFDHIKKCLGSDAHLRICLSFEDWLKQVV